jgi:hypothetical protein
VCALLWVARRACKQSEPDVHIRVNRNNSWDRGG